MKLNIYLKLYSQVAHELVKVFKNLREKILNGEIEIDIDFNSSFEDGNDGIDIELDDFVFCEIGKIIKNNSLLNDYYKIYKNNVKISDLKEYAYHISDAFNVVKYSTMTCDILPPRGTEEFKRLYKLVNSIHNNLSEETIRCFMTEINKNTNFKRYCMYIYSIYSGIGGSVTIDEIPEYIETGFNELLDEGLTVYKESISEEWQAKLKLAEQYIDPLLNKKHLSDFCDSSILKLINKESYLTLNIDSRTITIKHIRPRF